MSIQLTRYFRVLVIGEENKFVGDIIEKDLGFRSPPGAGRTRSRRRSAAAPIAAPSWSRAITWRPS